MLFQRMCGHCDIRLLHYCSIYSSGCTCRILATVVYNIAVYTLAVVLVGYLPLWLTLLQYIYLPTVDSLCLFLNVKLFKPNHFFFSYIEQCQVSVSMFLKWKIYIFRIYMVDALPLSYIITKKSVSIKTRF